MEAWFLSDIHLRSHNERNGEILLRFLHSLQQKNPAEIQLYLLGDIFDLWVGGHKFFAKKFQPIVDALKVLSDRGVQMMYIEGNHDVHIEGFFHKKLGMDVHVEAQYVLLNDLVIRLEHGDLINTNDHKYLKYRETIRSFFVRQLGLWIPGTFWDYVGTLASKKSRHKSSQFRHDNEKQLVEMIRKHAGVAYQYKPFDIIISGHMHIFDDYEVQIENKKVRSINLGSWLEDSVKVLHLDGKNISWQALK